MWQMSTLPWLSAETAATPRTASTARRIAKASFLFMALSPIEGGTPVPRVDRTPRPARTEPTTHEHIYIFELGYELRSFFPTCQGRDTILPCTPNRTALGRGSRVWARI